MTTQPKTFSSDLLGAVHKAASDPYKAGVLAKRTRRRFNAPCLTPVEPLDTEAIRGLREREWVRQAVLARHLSVTTGSSAGWSGARSGSQARR